ncbi:hypothetical protein [Parasitella parasitica]|uniref:Uncharacterized protein n=1 Tax=Parasitella parasitica TaxID=35722 RepID=A0A0B7NWB6_9FUNG|nr:hypothetical protein [Parasitella parasitica]
MSETVNQREPKNKKTSAGIELENKPNVESEDVACAIECIAGIDGLLGPTPIILETLKSSSNVYTKFLWTILKEMEMAEMRDICSDTFNNLTRQEQKLILKSILQIINGDDTNFRIRYQLDPAFVAALTNVTVFPPSIGHFLEKLGHFLSSNWTFL